MDTEPLWYLAELKFARSKGHEWLVEQALQMVGKPLVHTGQALKDLTGADESPEEIADYLVDAMVEAIAAEDLRWRPGMQNLIGELQGDGIPLGLVSSSVRRMVDAVVGRLPEGTFDVVVAGDEVENMKPHPDPYLKAARVLGVDPKGCIVIEDSGSGLASAHSAGTKVIGIPCMLDIPAAPGRSRFASGEDVNLAILRRIAAGETIDQLGQATQ